MLERLIERSLVASRWLMAPFYIGLVLVLLVVLYRFGVELVHFLATAQSLSEEETILGALTVIDLTLMGSLLLIVIFSGYENFVSKIDATGQPRWPDWMTRVDFTGLKLKLLASIVLISAIQLLKGFMSLEKHSDRDLVWLVAIHLVFIVSSALLAVTDWLQSRTGKDEH